ncbi:MAG: PAS domain S-box protein, partial [Deltaproteobacteria bacterium]
MLAKSRTEAEPRVSESAAWRQLLAPAAVVVCTAAIYFVAATLGLRLAFVAEQVTLVWPPTGISLAALLVFGSRAWPGIALGAFLANATHHEPLGTACGIAAGNTLEAVAGAWLLRRVGFDRRLERLKDVLALVVLAALGSTLVSATVGVTSLCVGGVQPWDAFASIWWVWWIGDAMGDLVMAPVLLVWARAPRTGWRPRRVGEALVLLGGLLAVGLLVFIEPAGARLMRDALPYKVFPFVIWGALRFGQRGAVTVTFVASSLAVLSSVQGWGPFSMGTPHENLVALQFFNAVVAVSALLLGAAIAERDSAEGRGAADYVRLQVSEGRLRLALEGGRMGAWDWDLLSGEIEWSENLEAIHGLPPGSFGGTYAAFRALVHPDDRDLVNRAISRAAEEGPGYEVEFRTVRPDGSIRWVAAKGRVVRDAAGRVARMIGVGTDVTERKRLADELEQRAAELADADRRKDE